MALATFTPPVRPSPGGARKPVISLITTEFGDGYTLAQPKGLNHIRQTASLNWNGLTLAQRDALEAFFVAQGGYKPFWYQPYGYAAALKWTCAEWSSSPAAPWTFRAELVQSFNAAT